MKIQLDLTKEQLKLTIDSIKEKIDSEKILLNNSDNLKTSEKIINNLEDLTILKTYLKYLYETTK